MTPIHLEKEVVVRIPDQMGSLSKLLTPLAEAKLDMKGISLMGWANDGLVRFHTDDTKKAMDILTKNRFTCWEQDVVALEISHEPGKIAEAMTKLSQKDIDVRGMYASTGTGANTTLYFWTNDNKTALNVLK